MKTKTEKEGNLTKVYKTKESLKWKESPQNVHVYFIFSLWNQTLLLFVFISEEGISLSDGYQGEFIYF